MPRSAPDDHGCINRGHQHIHIVLIGRECTDDGGNIKTAKIIAPRMARIRFIFFKSNPPVFSVLIGILFAKCRKYIKIILAESDGRVKMQTS